MMFYQLVDDGPLDRNTTTSNIIVDPVTAVTSPTATPVPVLPLWALKSLVAGASVVECFLNKQTV